MLDLVIIGAGPAGLAAAIYAKRAELDFVILEKEMMGGGQIISTSEVENYPGIYPVGGFDIAMNFINHANGLGVQITNKEVVGIEAIEKGKKVLCKDGTNYETKTVIISGGADHKELGVPGEDKFRGHGVSYCATCDGAFFKGKDLVVVGGGDVAVEDALFLSKLANKVYLVHRRDSFRAAKTLVTKLLNTENITFVKDSVVEEIKGDEKVTGVRLKNVKTEEKTDLAVDGVFIAVGMSPKTEQYKGLVDLDRTGYVIAGEDCVTSDPAIFAAGDIRTKQLRQVVTAASDGANALTSVERYISANF
ncbi:MAG: thioredoxin-disulfide reductase [Lachnospiraceae bacterium]|nr:thioredoxin-disulfide reductase [Lachnospiraceae bacterium]